MKAWRLIRTLSSKADFWPLVVVLFFGWLACRSLFGSGYFNMHDDLQMMRQLEMEKCFFDGQIPCRWVPDMGFGYGFPLFNFYPPLPYLVGMLLRLIGYSFMDTAKGLFIIAFMASGVTMYYFAKEFFGRRGGILSSVFYVWAPYHAVDIYVRGAMNESWALIFFPAILLTSYKLITDEKEKILRWILILALSWFGLLTSHNLMVLIFTPVFAIWCLFWWIKSKAWSRAFPLAISGVFALGLAAFFTLPVVFEQKFVHADTLVQGYFEYVAHFASIRQLLFSRFWGYGPSVWMAIDDKMSFQLGHIHWIGSLIVLLFVVMRFVRKRRIDNIMLLTTFFIFLGWLAAFMAHEKSTQIWQMFSPLRFVQFPWRFLTLSVLGFSIAMGALAKWLPKRLSLLVIIILSLGLVAFNWNYFKPEHGKLGPLTDEEKFSGAAWDLQRTAGIYDYLPKTALENPRDGQNGVAEVVNGEAQIQNPLQGTRWASFDTAVASESAVIRINIYDFPDWKVVVDDQPTDIFIPEYEKWGRIHIAVPQGQHRVYAWLADTPIRTISNWISLVSWIILVAVVYKNYRSKDA